jgi:DNA-binding transcriptional LysR family regulator
VLRRGHPLTLHPKPRLADVLAYDWVLPGPQTTLRRQIDAAFRADNLDPPVHAVDSVSFLTTRALLLATDFLAVWPVQLAALESLRHDIAVLDLPLPTTRRPIGITTRADDPTSPAAALLIQSLRDTAAHYAESLT